MRLKAIINSWLIGTAALLCTATASAKEYALNMPKGVTDISQNVYGLHMAIFIVCCIIGVLVFGAIFYSVIYHRKSRGVKPAQFHESTLVEILWTVVPFLILIGMAIPATKTLIAMEDTSASDLTVKITGYQWKWKYDYLDGDSKGISFFSDLSTPMAEILGEAEKNPNYLIEVDNHLVVPINKKIRFMLTSADVNHAWWVPQLALKKDAIPGFTNQMWTVIKEPGVYRGKCAELCGKDHGFMPVVVEALNETDYAAWVASKKPKAEMVAENAAGEASMAKDTGSEEEPAMVKELTMDELMAQGEGVYGIHCVACHQADGKGIPNVFPSIIGSQIATGPADLHIKTIVDGVQGTAMQAFGGQLNDEEIAAVITYQRNAFGNEIGDFVQPADVNAQR